MKKIILGTLSFFIFVLFSGCGYKFNKTDLPNIPNASKLSLEIKPKKDEKHATVYIKEIRTNKDILWVKIWDSSTYNYSNKEYSYLSINKDKEIEEFTQNDMDRHYKWDSYQEIPFKTKGYDYDNLYLDIDYIVYEYKKNVYATLITLNDYSKYKDTQSKAYELLKGNYNNLEELEILKPLYIKNILNKQVVLDNFPNIQSESLYEKFNKSMRALEMAQLNKDSLFENNYKIFSLRQEKTFDSLCYAYELTNNIRDFNDAKNLIYTDEGKNTLYSLHFTNLIKKFNTTSNIIHLDEAMKYKITDKHQDILASKYLEANEKYNNKEYLKIANSLAKSNSNKAKIEEQLIRLVGFDKTFNIKAKLTADGKVVFNEHGKNLATLGGSLKMTSTSAKLDYSIKLDTKLIPAESTKIRVNLKATLPVVYFGDTIIGSGEKIINSEASASIVLLKANNYAANDSLTLKWNPQIAFNLLMGLVPGGTINMTGLKKYSLEVTSISVEE